MNDYYFIVLLKENTDVWGVTNDSSVSVMCCGQAADKGQPSITVSHLWVCVPGSDTLLISTMLAWQQWTGAHQLASALAWSLCRPSAAWHKEESCQARRDEHKYPPTPWNKNTNKASPAAYECESLSVPVYTHSFLHLSPYDIHTEAAG